MNDFFVSYTASDRAWAEWIAWQLEEAQYTVTVQAWDFTGNWVLLMNEAMAETSRTIAVLSPDYFRSKYTPSEWANAFRLDPRAEKDLLIPVRVVPVELESIFAQLTYVDLVDVPESVAVERLLKRVRGERGKPSRPPAYPAMKTAPVRTIVARPPYPAEQEDTRRLMHARELLVRWRDLYAARVQELQDAEANVQQWRHAVPTTTTTDIKDVLTLAVEVGRDLETLPVANLAFASNYGLLVHETVYTGYAMDRVQHHADMIDFVDPDAYALENAGRVLAAALLLLRFRLDALPRGFIDTVAPAADLNTHRTLILARKDNEPVLHLIAVDRGAQFLGSFAARRLSLSPLCAWKNSEGTIDVVAEDSEHLYVWSNSQPHPSAQYASASMTFAARETALRDRAVIVDSHGQIRIVTASGDEEVVRTESDHLVGAAIWIDPLRPEEWYALTLTDAFELRSQHRQGLVVRRDGSTLWEESRYSHVNAWLLPCTLDSFPCVLVHRQVSSGEAVRFVDPVSLRSIRKNLFVRGPISSLVLAGSRWLVVFFMRGDHRIAVWDLSTDSDEPVSRWSMAEGEAYRPFVATESNGAFEVLFVLNQYGERRSLLCRFRWPEGTVEEIASFSDLRILPVTM
jgi:hypothetical protein